MYMRHYVTTRYYRLSSSMLEAVWAILLSVVFLTAVLCTRESTLTFSDGDDLMARDATQKIYYLLSLVAPLLSFLPELHVLFCRRFLPIVIMYQ